MLVFLSLLYLNLTNLQLPNDVELPPTVSNLSYLLEDDALDGPLKVSSSCRYLFLVLFI